MRSFSGSISWATPTSANRSMACGRAFADALAERDAATRPRAASSARRSQRRSRRAARAASPRSALQIQIRGYFVALNFSLSESQPSLPKVNLMVPVILFSRRTADDLDFAVREWVVGLAGADGAEVAVVLDPEVALELGLRGPPRARASRRAVGESLHDDLLHPAVVAVRDLELDRGAGSPNAAPL